MFYLSILTLHIVGHSPQNSDVEGLQRRQVALLRRVEQLQRPVGVLQKKMRWMLSGFNSRSATGWA